MKHRSMGVSRKLNHSLRVQTHMWGSELKQLIKSQHQTCRCPSAFIDETSTVIILTIWDQKHIDTNLWESLIAIKFPKIAHQNATNEMINPAAADGLGPCPRTISSYCADHIDDIILHIWCDQFNVRLSVKVMHMFRILQWIYFIMAAKWISDPCRGS